MERIDKDNYVKTIQNADGEDVEGESFSLIF